MKLKVDISLDAKKIIRKRGLNTNGFAQKWLTNEVAAQMDPYVPMQTGTLKNSRIVGDATVTYPGPYAHYHYRGNLALAPNGSSWAKKGEQKVFTDQDMTYHGSPMRGPMWDKRMWFDKKDQILRGLEKITGGTAK